MFSIIKNLFAPKSQRIRRPVTPGDYYVFRFDKTCYKVLKVLAVDEEEGKPFGVHFRLYGRRFAVPPTTVGNPADLDVLAKAPPPEQELTFDQMRAAMDMSTMTVGHLPYTYEGFLRMEPQFIQTGTVEETELVGYRLWEEDSGGYFT